MIENTWGEKSFSCHIFSKVLLLSYYFVFSCHSRSRSWVFPGMIAPDSRSRNVGMDFFIPFRFSNFGNVFFPFPSSSRTSGMELSIPVPVPELPNVIPAHPCSTLNIARAPGLQICEVCSRHKNQKFWLPLGFLKYNVKSMIF